jgi:hypothetical protein
MWVSVQVGQICYSREMCATSGFCDVLLSENSAGAPCSSTRRYNLTGVGVHAWVGGGEGNLARVEDGRRRWARCSRRALHRADLERSPRKAEMEFIVECRQLSIHPKKIAN